MSLSLWSEENMGRGSQWQERNRQWRSLNSECPEPGRKDREGDREGRQTWQISRDDRMLHVVKCLSKIIGKCLLLSATRILLWSSCNKCWAWQSGGCELKTENTDNCFQKAWLVSTRIFSRLPPFCCPPLCDFFKWQIHKVYLISAEPPFFPIMIFF